MRVYVSFPGLMLLVVLGPTAATAQPDVFQEQVRTLAATTSTGSTGAGAVRAVATRMRAALDEWDRQLDAAQTPREATADAPGRAGAIHLARGRAYQLRGRTADALREFEAATAYGPSSSEAQLLRALTLDAAGRRPEAAQAFVASWALDPDSLVKAYYVARHAVGAPAADRARARAALAGAYGGLDVTIAPPAPPFPTLALIPDSMSPTPVVGDRATGDAFALLCAGRLDEAIASLERGATSPAASDDARAHFAAAQRHEIENRVTDARRGYEATLRAVLAGRAPIFVALGRLAQVDGDGPAAIAAFEQAVHLRPNDPQMHRELADAYLSQLRRDDAMAELTAALIVAPRDALAHAAMGSLFLDDDRPADAVRALARALEIMPTRYQARYTLARALDRLGRSEEAARERALFEKARVESLGQRRRIMATDQDKEEAVRREQTQKGGK